MITNDKVRCPSCMGTKKALRLGMLPGDCNMCKATGFIERPKDNIIPSFQTPSEIKKDETFITTSSIRQAGNNNDKGKTNKFFWNWYL